MQVRSYDEVLPCGCSLKDGFCGPHQFTMSDIHEAWRNGSDRIRAILWSLQDGYGEPGYVPPQGYDWSGIRDSSTDAIEAMYAAVHA